VPPLGSSGNAEAGREKREVDRADKSPP